MGKDLKGKELGTGISQRKDGLYVARYTDRFGRRQAPMYAKSEREIKKMYRDVKYEDEHNVMVKGAQVTLDQWYETWLNVYAPDKLKLHSIHGYNISYRVHIKPTFGYMMLQDITPVMIKKWANTLHEKGLKSASRVLSVLKAILLDAQIAGLITMNPAVLISVKETHVPKKAVALTSKQLTTLLNNYQYDTKKEYTDWMMIIKFLVLTGYRFGEMAALRWSDIDWAKRVMYVRRTLHSTPGARDEAYFNSPKSAKSVRSTPITEEIEKILNQEKEFQELWRQQSPNYWGRQKRFAKDLVFTTKYGSYLKNSTFNDMLKEVVRRINCKLPEEERLPEITAHCLRDTCASLCYKEGMPLKDIQELLGHGEQAMTLYYIQVDQEEYKERLNHYHSSVFSAMHLEGAKSLEQNWNSSSKNI